MHPFLFPDQHDCADHGNQQQNGRHFKRQKILIEQASCPTARRLSAVLTVSSGGNDIPCRAGACDQKKRRFHRQKDSQRDRQWSLPRQHFCFRKAFCTEQHDHEQEQHHDRARIHGHLGHGNKRRSQQQIEHRHRDESSAQGTTRNKSRCDLTTCPGGRNGNEGEDQEED